MKESGVGTHYTLTDIREATKTFNFTNDIFAWLSEPLAYVLANHTRLSPNSITLLGAVFGLLGSVLFYLELWVAAGFAFSIFFLLDCCDGTIARIKDQASERGAMLDLACDRTVLLVAVLARMADHLGRDQAAEAWLCAGYLAAHYVVDLQWLMNLYRNAGRPAQFQSLKAILKLRLASMQAAAAPAPRSGWRKFLHRISRIEGHLRPTPWVCNIVFILGACLMHDSLTALYLSAILALQWPMFAFAIRRHFKPMVTG